MDAETQRMFNNLIREAVVFEVNYSTQRIKVKNDAGWESNWLRFGTVTAGKNKQWQPPTIGEQVVILSPGGDLAQGIVVASLFSDANPANGSSSAETNWDIDGTLNINTTADINLKASGNVKINGARIDLNK